MRTSLKIENNMQQPSLSDRLFNRVINTGAFLHQSEAMLKKALAGAPDHPKLLWQLGEIYRQQGNLTAARETYRHLLHLQPDHPYARCLGPIFDQQAFMITAPLIHESPVPFVHVQNFLNALDQEQVWGIINENQPAFSQALLGNRELNLESRSSHVLYHQHLQDIEERFLDKIKSALADILPKLGFLPFDLTRAELQLTMHLDGDFFKTHKDIGNSGRTGTQHITFVYYFHCVPKRFTGGDLLLFDTNIKTDTYNNRYTRISPDHNSLIFFPSWAFHQVTPIQLATNRYDEGRFTLNGWLHKPAA